MTQTLSTYFGSFTKIFPIFLWRIHVGVPSRKELAFFRYRTVKHSIKRGNSYFTSLFVDNDLTYPEVSITCNAFHLSRLLPFFLGRLGWGGVEGRWSFVVIIEANYRKTFRWRKSAFVKYYVTENVFCIWSAEAKNFAIKEKVKTKVRKVWTKAILHMRPTCKV